MVWRSRRAISRLMAAPAAEKIPAGVQTGFEIVPFSRIIEITGQGKLPLVQFFEKIGGRGVAAQIFGIKSQGRVEGRLGFLQQGFAL